MSLQVVLLDSPVRAHPRRATRRGRSLLLGVLVPLLLVLGSGFAAAQQQVTGTVTSAADGRALARVQVTLKGSTSGALTDAAGRYTLNVPSLADTLVFTSVGFARREVPIAGRATVDVALSAQAVALEGLVVVGYGTQRKRDLTGAVAQVDASQVTQQPTPSVTQALQGRIAGVQVTPASGEPGQPAVVRIRGVGTLNNASPLYVVDGMLLDDIGFLNPADIASLQVLKDASATAIYGSRGANGVIIVTTRQGEVGDDTRFSINAWTGVQSVQKKIDLVNAQQYATLANELAANQGQTPIFPDPNTVGRGVDWQDEIFETAPTNNVQLSASGSSERVRYYFSANLVEQQGVLPKSDYTRFTFRLNNDYDLTESFRFGHNLNFSYTDDQPAPGVLDRLYRADPTILPRDPVTGEWNDLNLRSSAGNPAAQIFYTNNEVTAGRLVGNLFAEKDFFDDLTLRSSFGLDYERRDTRNFTPKFYVSPTQQTQESSLNVGQYYTRSWLWENTATWNYATDNSRLTLLGGVTAQAFDWESLGGGRRNLVGDDPALWYLNAGNADAQSNFNGAGNWKMLSYLFRTNYTLLDRYLLTASMRADGSSRFGEDNRYGYFPSFALGWNLAEERFFERFIDAVPAMKLRASWGKIGNDKITDYPAFATVSGNLNAVFGPDGTLYFGATPIALANPAVQWEETAQTNVGADFELLGGSVSGSVDWYRRVTSGILVEVPIPRYIGAAGSPIVNAAEVMNRGLEGALAWEGEVGGVGLRLGGNASWLKNEVQSLGGGKDEIIGGDLGNGRQTTRTVVGQPIGSFWGYRVQGVFQNEAEIASSPTRGGEKPGDLRYADTNGDGKITTADRTWLGSPIPDMIYGLNAEANWKGFDFSAVFSGQAGNEIYNGKKAVRIQVENFETSFLDRWHGEGTSTREPRITTSGHNYEVSDRFIEDGSYFKLQTAQLGYRLPESLSRRLNLGQARLYVGGSNLFTISDYSGYTPELTGSSVISSGIDRGVYPAIRTITAGIDLTF